MVQIFRFLFIYSAFFLFRKIIKNLTVFITLILLAAALYFSSNYISQRLPGVLWNMSGNLEEEDITREQIVEKEVIIKKGDTFNAILRNQNLPSADIIHLIKLAGTAKLTARLNIGQTVKFYYETKLIEQAESDIVEEKLILSKIVLKIDGTKSIEFVRADDNFIINDITVPLKKMLSRYEATVSTNLISSLQKAGLTTNSVIKLINAYSYQLDLQRQIKPGDKITVIAEKFVTPDNKLSRHGKILYASLTSKGTNYNIYLYSPSGKEEDLGFFTENGQSIKGTLLKTPIDVVRISSHFGYRKTHPVHGFGRMHKGIDFAASTGTPIYSAGDGVVQFIGWKNGYGRFISVKHNNGLSTAYAHASKFAKNITKGSRVKQGQIIAYVGSSGHATGPHLHYEVLINGVQVNPLKFKSTPGIKLQGKQLAVFNVFRANLQKLHKRLIANPEIPSEEFQSVNL